GTRSTLTHGNTHERSSQPRYVNDDNEWHDEDNTHQDHYEVEIMHHYKWFIRDRVGHEREALPDIKNIRVSPPEKYAGQDNMELFDTWLAGLLLHPGINAPIIRLDPQRIN